MKREVRHLRGLSKVLSKMADEAEADGMFSKEHEELLKKIGSDILFKGVTIDYRERIINHEIELDNFSCGDAMDEV
jgi:hypothetical protein